MTSPYDHPDYRALLAAVLATPDDDLPRLVLADWLEENGQSERAEFIRVQIELARNAHQHKIAPGDGINCHCRIGGSECGRVLLQRRESELFDRHAGGWFGDRWAILHCGPPEEDSAATHPDLGHAFVTRGFVSEYHGPLADWCGERCDVMACAGSGQNSELNEPCDNCHGTGRTVGIGPAVVAAHPVEKVTFTDRIPARDNATRTGRVAWTIEDLQIIPRAARLPVDLFTVLEQVVGDLGANLLEFPTPESAHATLSVASIRWALAQPAQVPA